MAQYIDKNLVFEIVKGVLNLLIEEDKVKSLLPKISNDAPEIYEGFMSNLSDLYKFVNNEYKDKIVNAVLDNIALDNLIEVKEVDFGTEVYKYMDEHFRVYDDGNQTLQNKDKHTLIGRVDAENIAKHFFELGLKTQKGE